MIPSTVLQSLQFTGHAYAVALSIFRHTVHEDTGFLSTITDLIPFIFSLSFLFLPRINDTAYSRDIISGALGLYLAHKLYKRHVAGQIFKKIDLTGKVYIVTGSNTGIGFETARELVKMNAEVLMACRSIEKANQARELIIESTKCSPTKIRVIKLDLCSFTSVRRFVEEFQSLKLPLHGLINNAGIMMATKEITPAGLETVMTANHFSHFLLTNLLLPELEKSNGRVINLTSSLHKLADSFHFDDIMSEKNYSLFGTYAQSKLANILFTMELQRRLKKKGSLVTCNAVHPGCVSSDVSRNMGFMTKLEKLFTPVLSLFRKTPLQGAYCSIYAAISPELTGIGGKYLVHCSGSSPSSVCYDEVQASQLWIVSEKITGINQ